MLSADQDAAFDLCAEAVTLDKNNVRALSLLPVKYLLAVIYGRSPHVEADVQRMDELASRALAIDPDAYPARLIKAYVLLLRKRFEEAIAEGERAIALNRSFVESYLMLQDANNTLGRSERAIEYPTRRCASAHATPRCPSLHEEKGTALFILKRDDEASNGCAAPPRPCRTARYCSRFSPRR